MAIAVDTVEAQIPKFLSASTYNLCGSRRFKIIIATPIQKLEHFSFVFNIISFFLSLIHSFFFFFTLLSFLLFSFILSVGLSFSYMMQEAILTLSFLLFTLQYARCTCKSGSAMLPLVDASTLFLAPPSTAWHGDFRWFPVVYIFMYTCDAQC